MMMSPFPLRCVLLSFFGALCVAARSQWFVLQLLLPLQFYFCLSIFLSRCFLWFTVALTSSHFFTEIHIYCSLLNTKKHCINIFSTVMQPTYDSLSCRGWWLNCLASAVVQFVLWTGQFCSLAFWYVVHRSKYSLLLRLFWKLKKYKKSIMPIVGQNKRKYNLQLFIIYLNIFMVENFMTWYCNIHLNSCIHMAKLLSDIITSYTDLDQHFKPLYKSPALALWIIFL